MHDAKSKNKTQKLAWMVKIGYLLAKKIRWTIQDRMF